MQPTLQTELAEGKGNCVSACVASILNLRIEEVPNFRLAEDQWVALQEWLGKRKLCAIRFVAQPEYVYPIPQGVYCILTGDSPRRNVLHAVVGYIKDRSWSIVYDPHPDGTGLKGHPQWVTFFGVLME